jgi:hypothetical protein
MASCRVDSLQAALAAEKERVLHLWDEGAKRVKERDRLALALKRITRHSGDCGEAVRAIAREALGE